MIISLSARRQGGDGQTASYHYEFDRDEVLVGRDRAVDVRLPHPGVSLVHLRLLRKRGRIWVMDVDSTNGTFLDGRRLVARRGYALKEGSQLRLGPFELTLGTPPAGELTVPADTARLARQMVLELLGGDAAQAQPWLEVENSPEQGRRLCLPALSGPVLVGRGQDCALQLSDADCSRHHFEVQNKGEVVELRDLGSKNGMELNGTRVEGVALLRNGDLLTVGQTRLRFVDAAQGMLRRLEQDESILPSPSEQDAPVPSEQSVAEEQGHQPWSQVTPPRVVQQEGPTPPQDLEPQEIEAFATTWSVGSRLLLLLVTLIVLGALVGVVWLLV